MQAADFAREIAVEIEYAKWMGRFMLGMLAAELVYLFYLCVMFAAAGGMGSYTPMAAARISRARLGWQQFLEVWAGNVARAGPAGMAFNMVLDGGSQGVLKGKKKLKAWDGKKFAVAAGAGIIGGVTGGTLGAWAAKVNPGWVDAWLVKVVIESASEGVPEIFLDDMRFGKGAFWGVVSGVPQAHLDMAQDHMKGLRRGQSFHALLAGLHRPRGLDFKAPKAPGWNPFGLFGGAGKPGGGGEPGGWPAPGAGAVPGGAAGKTTQTPPRHRAAAASPTRDHRTQQRHQHHGNGNRTGVGSPLGGGSPATRGVGWRPSPPPVPASPPERAPAAADSGNGASTGSGSGDGDRGEAAAPARDRHDSGVSFPGDADRFDGPKPAGPAVVESPVVVESESADQGRTVVTTYPDGTTSTSRIDPATDEASITIEELPDDPPAPRPAGTGTGVSLTVDETLSGVRPSTQNQPSPHHAGTGTSTSTDTGATPVDAVVGGKRKADHDLPTVCRCRGQAGADGGVRAG